MKTLVLVILALAVGSTAAFSTDERRRCSRKPNPGKCQEATQKYYYNTTSNSCELFGYTGCGGNNNRFDSEDACMEACHRMLVHHCYADRPQTLQPGEENCHTIQILGYNACYKTFVNCPDLNRNPTDMEEYEVPEDCTLTYLKRPGQQGTTVTNCNNDQD